MDLVRFLVVALAGAGLAGCTASEAEVRPPEGELLFPTAVAVSPDEQVAFVVTGNSDLAYDSGTVQVVDLAVVSDVVTAWRDGGTRPAECVSSVDAPETLICPEQSFLLPGAGVRVGNFASAIGVQELDGAGRLRLIVPVRGDPSITWMEWDPAARRLACSGSQGFALCDEDHRMTRILEDRDLPVPDEPYGIYVDSASEFAIVTHFTGGAMTLVDTPRAGVPTLSDAVATGISGGLSGVAGRTPGPENVVYVQSRDNDRVFLMAVAKMAPRAAFLVPLGFFFQNGIGGTNDAGGLSDDSRGIVFGQGGDRAYMVNRSPPSLQVLDTSRGPDGAPQNRLVATADVCRRATAVAVADTGAGERAYVPCYLSGELYVIDPRGSAPVEATTLVGRGPIGAAAATTRRLLLVPTFLDNSIAVVDIDPASPRFSRVVLRIGDDS